MKKLIERERSVIVALDMEPERTGEVVRATCGVDGIGGYKIGLNYLFDDTPLKTWVKIIKEISGGKPLIFDLQKAGNDIPLPTGVIFASGCAKSGVDAVILFPFTGPVTQEAWTKACQDEGLVVLTGGHMTHKNFLWSPVSERGYIHEEAPQRIYRLACELGVRDFVVPGNQPDWVEGYRKIFEDILGQGNFTLYAPGFITQGGDISETGQVAGKNWHAIVGSAIYKAEEIRAAALQVVKQINPGP